MNIEKILLEKHGDERGQLIAVENNKDIPFDIKRIYYIFDTKKNVRRGFHAHFKLKQVLICVKGSCKIHLEEGDESAEVTLDNPSKGLLINGLIWREMYDFSDDAVLLVLASDFYDEKDYIRDYNRYLKLAKGEKNE